MVVAVNNTSTTPISSAGTPSAMGAQASATDQQDRFMKLLVAQLKNQDPMNPMDNAQMTSQMAQISTVSGISQLNETIKSMSAQFTSMQMMQGAGMIGHNVMVQSNTLSIDAGKAKGAIDLSGNADSVQIQVLSPGGQLLDTLSLGAQTTGRHTFEWDAKNYNDVGNPTFKVVATSGKQAVAATALAVDTVTGISTAGNTMNIQLKGRATVTYDAVQALL